MDITSGKWDRELLEVCGGEALRAKIGEEPVGGGTNLGKVAQWWVERYGFNQGRSRYDCCGRETGYTNRAGGMYL